MTEVILDDDLEDYDEFDEMDLWEDNQWYEHILKKYPPGWHIVKIGHLTKMKEIDVWLTNNVRFGQYAKEGWGSDCAYSVGIVFESGKDAVMFKLRWR